MRTISDGEEGRFVAQSIWENMMNHQLKPDDFCVLYRTNSQSRAIEDALRKKNIDYKIYGGISFYQRKEIKDILSYLRILINPNDEEALKRIINYPARGIGATTIDRLTIAANHYKKSIFEIIKYIDKIDLKINSGTKNKLQNFMNMILRLQIESQTKNAFEIAEIVVKQTQLIKDLEKDGTPEAVSKVENVQELLNGIKDFITDKIEEGEDASLTSFLEDVALATDFDSESKDDKLRVSLMSIHQSKGLEYPYVYIVGLEENLFPSAMSMNTRSELEEERRLFYVALTRAEKVAYLTYTKTRYRWGKLIDAEPSRFIEEIDDKYLDIITPPEERRFNPMLDASIFGDVPQNKIRFKSAKSRDTRKKGAPKTKPEGIKITPPKHLKKVTNTNGNTNLFDSKLAVGNIVEHLRFGKGEVMKIEGKGADLKAEINFENGGYKKLLLRFAKLKVIG